ncbi:dTDP-glucose 4,6-dehydratase [Oceanobacillus manasiensis]|uniref:dTDP-glucose 4,6-dehydratase n=1 Tax=Oceanobacillus manasiensis TaxID=586413 RepID=UPI0005A9AEC7|nr:dTDP-glucose 4,6-dehydratase [Oceanobacillus manasiensis]
MNKQKPVLLITGGAGFIGSNFIRYMHKTYPNYHLLNVDKLTYAGNTTNLQELESSPSYSLIEGDIADEQLVQKIFNEYDIHGVIHFAAESHVDRSIEDSKQFVQTNVLGTLVLLQAAKQDWERKGVLHERRFHQISTDEVYGSLGETGKFSEETPYDPRNPYSASKAGANLMVQSFGHTYNMNVVISSSSNNYGPRQHTEKLIPTIISKALSLESIPIYGDGKNVRDWLYVDDHCRALDLIFHQSAPFSTYNIGGGNEVQNLEIAKGICSILDDIRPDILEESSLASFRELITHTKDRLGHDRRYAVDDSKLRNELDWEPKEALSTGVRKTIQWYVDQWESVATP